MTRDELYFWIKHSIQLTKSALKVAPDLVERDHMKQEQLDRYKWELALDQRVYDVERSGDTNLTEDEQIWRWWLYYYAFYHAELWQVNSEECNSLVHLARAVRDAEFAYRQALRDAETERERQRLILERPILMEKYTKQLEAAQQRVKDENVGRLLSYIHEHGKVKAYNRLKKEGWEKVKAKQRIEEVAALLEQGLEAKHWLEQLENV